MGVDRTLRDKEILGDLTIGVPSGDEECYLSHGW
jgi:hypothetical protein